MWPFIGEVYWTLNSSILLLFSCSSILATWCKEWTCWKKPLFWERLRAGGEGGGSEWGGCMASLTQWTWVWASSGRQRRPGKPGVLQPTGSQRVGHDLVAKQQQHSLQGTTHWTIVLWEKIGGSTAVFSCSSYIKISRLCILLWWAWGLLVCMEACLGLLRYGKIH